MSQKPLRIFGLTGGAGSGKSEVAKRLVELGIPVIEADKIGHQLIEPGRPVAQALTAEFGDKILSNGKIDRSKLANIAFSDDQARRTLNAITHPIIVQEIRSQCKTLAENGHTAVVVEAAIIAENGKREPGYDGLILVMAPEAMRIERLVQHRGMGREQAQLRIKAQTPPENKIPLADWVITNDGDLNQLQDQVDQVAKAIQQQAEN